LESLAQDDVTSLLALLLESVPIGVALFDTDLRLRFINQRQAQINNFSVEAHLGKRIGEFLPQAVAVIEPKLQFVLDTGCPLINQEIRGQAPFANGHVLHRMASFYPWRVRGHQIKGVLAIVQDSTIDHFAQQLLEESQQRLLKVLDNLLAFVGVMELDGTLSHANKAPLDAGGLKIEDVRGKKFWDCYWFCHDPFLQHTLKNATERCRRGEVFRLDLEVRMANNSRMWIDFVLAPLRDNEGNVTHLIPSGIDISQRHESEMSLKYSEERYQSIVESSEDAIITKSLSGIITGWNSAASRLLGYSEQEAVGQHIVNLFPAEKFEEEAAILSKISRGESVNSFETLRKHQDGHLIPVAITVSPLRDKQGVVVGACKLMRDISLQKKQIAIIERALEEKTSLLFEVHHRVKNNLQIVSSLLNLQARKVAPEVASALAECQGRIRAMALVHQLLYESESMAEIDLSDYIRQLVVLTEATCSARLHDIEIHFMSNVEAISLDIQRTVPCGLVVYELVLNAVKHAFPVQARGRIGVSITSAGNDLVHLTVSDNGRGLPENFRWSEKGGLGTQLIPMFVQQMGGRLITSSSAQGASITVELKPTKQRVQNAN
jgi:PAS domain S-box-containing protein